MSRLAAALFLSLPGLCAAAGVSADAVVAKADEVRNPQLDYSVQVTVTSEKPGEEKTSAKYQVLVKGKDRTVIKTTYPELERGKSLLMRDGSLWAFLPEASKPVRVSLQQRLFGEVANGDLARANFAGDYAARLVEEGRGDYVLELTAKSEETTYHRVVYRVQKGTFRPLQARFFAFSGKELKTCLYEGYKNFGGRPRPTRLIMQNALVKGQRSVIEYYDLKVDPLPEKYFTKDYMKKFK